jgi:hypothetical protein
MSDEKKNPEKLEDLEAKQDPKGGIIAILIGLSQPAPTAPVLNPVLVDPSNPNLSGPRN